MMSFKSKAALLVAIIVWSSAFVGIRAGLNGYSPEGLALLRFLVASTCMTLVYFLLAKRSKMLWRDIVPLLLLGVVGIGFYNITLNRGEEVISSGMSSFIIAQSPVITALFALLFLGERFNTLVILGFAISMIGVICIALGEMHGFTWDISLTYILAATFIASIYSISQKTYLKKYSAIETTTLIIWGGTLFLMIYFPKLQHDIVVAPLSSTLTVIYLGVFPAAIGYLAWGYALSEIPAAHAASYLYFMPFIALLIGWLWLGEVPVMLSVVGGLLAIGGVWLVNHSYRYNKQ